MTEIPLPDGKKSSDICEHDTLISLELKREIYVICTSNGKEGQKKKYSYWNSSGKWKKRFEDIEQREKLIQLKDGTQVGTSYKWFCFDCRKELTEEELNELLVERGLKRL